MVRSSWRTETGHLVCSWREGSQRIQYNPSWMQAASDPPSGYLQPLPDFASHSPFGGASSFRETVAPSE
jgi:hypothetical protein